MLVLCQIKWRNSKSFGDLALSGKKAQVDQKGKPGDVATQRLHQLASGDGRSTRSQQVVVDEHVTPFRKGVNMDLDRSFSVFQGIVVRDGLERQLPRLSYRDKRALQGMGQQRAKNETPGFYGSDSLHVLRRPMRHLYLH